MSEDSIIQAVTDYFMACPLLKDGVFRVDALSGKAVEYAIETSIFNPVIKTYVNGDTERQYQFNFSSREFYSTDRIQSILNNSFYEELAAWVENQDRKKNYPALPNGCYPQSLEVLTSGYIFDASMRNARYQIQLRLTYIKEVN